MTTKHTPGPWEISRGAQNHPYSIEAESKTVAFIKMQTEALVTMANAQAISALPDLLEACQDSLDNYFMRMKCDEGCDGFDDIINQLKQAIKKAGE